MLSQRRAPGPFGSPWLRFIREDTAWEAFSSQRSSGEGAAWRPGGAAGKSGRVRGRGRRLLLNPAGGRPQRKPVRRPHWPSGWKGGANAHVIGPATPEEQSSETLCPYPKKDSPSVCVGGWCGGCWWNPAPSPPLVNSARAENVKLERDCVTIGS